VAQAASVQEGILAEVARNQQQPYDLIVMGAAAEWISDPRLFGAIDDWVANQAPCSVLLARRYEPVAISWLRWQVKMMEKKP
jgi:nucleotide-binding universal stress UspA family protein